MTFPFPFACPRPNASIVFATSDAQAGTGATVTFTSKSIGTAQTGRRIVVAAGGPGSGSAVTITGVTCGGVAMTQLVQNNTSGGGGFQTASLWILEVPTGTTADIVVSWSGSSSRCYLGVWAVYGLESEAARSTVTSGSDPHTGSITVPGGGVVIGTAAGGAGSSMSYTWTGVTEDFDATVAAVTLAYTGASAAFNAASTFTITANPNPFNAGSMVAVSLR